MLTTYCRRRRLAALSSLARRTVRTLVRLGIDVKQNGTENGGAEQIPTVSKASIWPL